MLINVSPGGRKRTADGGGLAITAPRTSRRDEEIAVRVTGAQPNATVRIEASTEDPDGVEWQSAMEFTADEDGVVDLAEQAPDSGSYDGVAPMGWCWSMTAETDARVTTLRDAERWTVDFEAGCGNRTAERTIERRLADPGVERRPVESDDLAGTFFEPAGEGPHPGVVALHGSGGHPPLADAALLASHGYAALALRYFGDPDPVPDELARVPLSSVDRAAGWLLERSAVRDGRLGVVGHSRGGELALLAGARFDWVGAVVSYVGSGVAYDTPQGPAAWTADGDPVPHVSASDGERRPGEDGTTPMLERALDAADPETVREATIPVEETDGPVLLVSGGDDPVWPSQRLSQVAADRLASREFAHDFEHLTYDDAGHFVTEPYLPKTDPVFGGTPAGMAAADADAWRATLDYLARGLGGGGTSTGEGDR